MNSLEELPEIARSFVEKMEVEFPGMYRRFPPQPAMCVAEEAGEFVGATRRAMGLARRCGEWSDAALELADVVFSSFIAAEVYGLDLEGALKEKVDIIFTRGFKEAA